MCSTSYAIRSTRIPDRRPKIPFGQARWWRGRFGRVASLEARGAVRSRRSGARRNSGHAVVPYPDPEERRMAGAGVSDGAPVMRPSGDTIFSREYAVPVVPLTDREWNDRLTQALGRSARPDLPFGRKEVEAASVRPPHWPSATRVILGRNGWVWLGLTSHPSRTDVDWAVMDARGTPLSSVRMPQGFTPHVATEDRVWGVWTEELDVPYVRRYRIR